jgi:divalent metal cation (Fe/Co/Zn/Cd) transporter
LVAVLLARESKELLIGERAKPELIAAIRRVASEDPCVIEVVDITTTQMAPDQVIATLGVQLEDQLRVPEVERLIKHIEETIRARFPDLFRVFVRPVSDDPKSSAEPPRERPEGREARSPPPA